MFKKNMLVLVFCVLMLAWRQSAAEETVLYDFEGAAALALPVRMQDYVYGKMELVAGKVGNTALKVTFLPSEKAKGSRYFDFLTHKEPRLDPRQWAEKKYRVVRFWLKGDGSENFIDLVASHWDSELKKDTVYRRLAHVSLEEPEWIQVTVPLDKFYGELSQANNLYFASPQNFEGFSFELDHFTAE